MKRVSLYLLVLVFLPIRISAQWTETASTLLGPLSQSVGAMSYSFGVVWAGTYSLWSSTNQGSTWVQNALNLTGDIAQISFIDHNDGLVTTHAGYVYKTSDGGATWTTIASVGSATSACFLDNTNNILVSEFQPGDVHYSRDGGTTWNVVMNNDWIREILPSANGKAYLLSGDWGPQEHIWITTNYGASWTEQAGEVNADSYSFDFNGCNNNNMIIVNEGYSYTEDYDGRSRLYISVDGGQTWAAPVNNASKYFAGSVTEGPNTIFAQTVSEVDKGLLRSTDNGVTWTNISGPASTGDTRLIAAIDDNTIIGSDVDGSIWVTHNSGGDSLSLSSSGIGASTLTLSHILQSVSDTTCSAKDTAFHLGGTGCPGVTLDSISITGSTAFSIGDTRGTPRSLDSLDSVRLVFTPTPPGTDTSYLHIKYDLGSGSHDTIITLIGHSTHLPSQLTLSPTTQSVVDTSCGPKDTAFRLSGTGCPGVTLTSITLSGSTAFQLADSRGTPRALDSLDSVRVVFTPAPPGIDTTYVHLQYNLGSGLRDTIITLIGSSRSTANTFTLSPTTQSVFQSVCAQKDTSYKLGGTGCPGVTLVSATITGSPAFGIEDARKTPRTLDSLDSVRIVYAPTPPGVDTSYLHLVYNSGNGNHDTTITLIGTLDPSLRSVTLDMSASPETVLATCVPIIIPTPLWVTGCIAEGGKLDSAYLTGSPAITISDTRRAPRGLGSFDSVQLQYLPGTTAPDTAILHLAYNLGSGIRDTTIMVIGYVQNPLPPPAILIPATVQSILSKSCGGSDTGLRIGVTGCPLVDRELDSVWLTGSPTIQINDTRSLPRSLAINDSLGVLYAPNGGGSDTAQLHIRYNVGSGEQDTTLTIIGTVASPLLSQPAQMRRESASAYYGGIDSLPLQLDLTTPINFDSLWNLVTDIQGTCAFDGSVVSVVQYLPPVPWTLVSFTAHPSSFDFEIRNNTKRAQNPLDLGTALFSPRSSELATSWVTMSQLLLRIGNQTNSLCVVDNEDNHWAVKALGIPTSGVTPTTTVPETDGIAIYPNPAGDELFVQNENELPASITMYDVIGRDVVNTNAAPTATSSIDISSLPSGAYFLVYHVGGRTVTKCITKQ